MRTRKTSVGDGTSSFGGSLYATPFVLQRETSNRHKVDEILERTMDQASAIPFLRSKLDPKLVKEGSENYTIRSQNSSGIRGLSSHKVRRIRTLNRKEQGWNSYVKPISKYNEQVHSSMKIPFERI
jgi:hypothetical protein